VKVWIVGLLAALVAGFSLARTSNAATVSFYTTGEFSSNHSDAVTFGGYTLSFSSDPWTVPDTPSYVDFGTFSVNGTGAEVTVAESFTLTVHQTLPGAGSDSFGTAQISGTIVVNQSSAYVQFSDPLQLSIATIGNPTIIYAIDEGDVSHPGRVVLMPPKTSGGARYATIDGQVTAVAVPVPAAVWTGSTSLVGLAGVAIGRKRRLR
jgi:hypothetical protein